MDDEKLLDKNNKRSRRANEEDSDPDINDYFEDVLNNALASNKDALKLVRKTVTVGDDNLKNDLKNLNSGENEGFSPSWEKGVYQQSVVSLGSNDNSDLTMPSVDASIQGQNDINKKIGLNNFSYVHDDILEDKSKKSEFNSIRCH